MQQFRKQPEDDSLGKVMNIAGIVGNTYSGNYVGAAKGVKSLSDDQQKPADEEDTAMKRRLKSMRTSIYKPEEQ